MDIPSLFVILTTVVFPTDEKIYTTPKIGNGGLAEIYGTQNECEGATLDFATKNFEKVKVSEYPDGRTSFTSIKDDGTMLHWVCAEIHGKIYG